MKLRNKKTGEIVEVESCNSTAGTIGLFFYEGRECDRAYNSIAELNEEWEDYEEPKEIYYVNYKGHIMTTSPEGNWDDEKQIGNYFETKEEAEKAVEKLKAWKRLKDKGFKFAGYLSGDGAEVDRIYAEFPYLGADTEHDLDLLFGGEE